VSERIARYRKLYPRIWRHPGFRKLKKSARELALYLLTGPQTNRIGCFHFSKMTAADDLNVGVETLTECLRDVSVTFGWHFDAAARVFYIPTWWKWNPPENENVLKGNLKDLNEIPACALVEAFARNLETLPDTFHQTFMKRCQIRLAERSPNQEQEQDQRTETETAHSRGALKGTAQNPAVLKVAREAIRYGSQDDLELLLDHFQSLFRDRHPGADCSKADALQALNVALSERRTANASHRPQ
jgi:hypothetical protein